PLAPDEPDEVGEDQHEPVRQEQLVLELSRVDPPEERVLDEAAENAGGDRGHDEGHPEADGRVVRERGHDGVGQVGRDHVERAVREVDHAQRAEDQRKARGQEKEDHPPTQTGEELDDEVGEVYFLTFSRSFSMSATGRQICSAWNVCTSVRILNEYAGVFFTMPA